MVLNKYINRNFRYNFEIKKAGLAAIIVSASCRSAKQIRSGTDEDMRARINGLDFREHPPQKNVQLFNIPPAFNGTCQRGNKKTIVFFVVLRKGKNFIDLIPRNSAFINEIKVLELSGMQDIELSLESQAMDCNNLPWCSIILVDLPLSYFAADVSITRRLWDSDDVKIIIDGKIIKNSINGKFKNWYFVGSFLQWFVEKRQGDSKRINAEFNTKCEIGIHYIELWADKKPVLHKIYLGLYHPETEPTRRAAAIIQNNNSAIIAAANEFSVDPVIVGSVVFEEQSTNVNFIDTLTDYVGGLLHINTSIGIGQVRIKTAALLENEFPELNPLIRLKDPFADSNIVRVERLKDPLTNLRYVAAKIKFDIDRWNAAGYSINDKVDILGTLYNVEEIDHPVVPHPSPEPNNFGVGTQNNYDRVKKMLGL